MRISTIFAHCDPDEVLDIKVNVAEENSQYLQISHLLGIFMSRAQLEAVRDALDAALAPSAQKIEAGETVNVPVASE